MFSKTIFRISLNKYSNHKFLTIAALLGMSFACVFPAQSQEHRGKSAVPAIAPATAFDLTHWKITLPIDRNKDGRADEVPVKKLKKYAHPDFFFLDDENRMVFTAPNKGAKTQNTSNTRSELRYMHRGKNTKIKTHDGRNNFAIKARENSDKFGSVGGMMAAILKVDHVALNTKRPADKSAFSVVIGQIHAVKYKNTESGFGYGNEPLKIFYKKWPGHETGSVFWTYERNLARDNVNRKDISYNVWGEPWDSDKDPKTAGIALGEDFSYTVNVHENTMYLTFESPAKPAVNYQINLVNNHNAYGEPDPLDNRYGYGGDSLYFKAGVYNQCSVRADKGGCGGTGDWLVDKANGDYTQASFSKLIVGPSFLPKVRANP